MASYLRNIFGQGPQSPATLTRSSHKEARSNGRARSASGSSYIYAEPSAAVRPFTAMKPAPTRSVSMSAPKAGAVMPPLQASYKQSSVYGQGPRRPSHQRMQSTDSYQSHRSHHSNRSSPIYRTSSSEHQVRPGFTPAVSFASSRTDSASSMHMAHHHRRPMAVSHSSWHAGHASSSSSVGSSNLVISHAQITLHPLLAASRFYKAPVSYDILYAPSSRTVVDRTSRAGVPTSVLAQPATTPGIRNLTLRSDKFPWAVVAKARSGSSSKFFIGNGEGHSSSVSNQDILQAVHETLMQRVTGTEWAALGDGSRAQRKVTRAYEKRCTRMGGGWEGGVRRVDWLHGKTQMVGVEMDKQRSGVGKLVFGSS